MFFINYINLERIALSVTVVILSVFAVGCENGKCLSGGDAGITYMTCQGLSSASGLFGNVAFEAGFPTTFHNFGYHCSKNKPYMHEADIACFDPATPVSQWEEPSWSAGFVLEVPQELSDCGSLLLDYVFAFDAIEAGGPVAGQSYALSSTEGSDYVGFVRGTEQILAYRIVSGELVVLEASLDGYRFDVIDLVIERSPENDSIELNLFPADCQVPDIISISTSSGSCKPEILDSEC